MKNYYTIMEFIARYWVVLVFAVSIACLIIRANCKDPYVRRMESRIKFLKDKIKEIQNILETKQEDKIFLFTDVPNFEMGRMEAICMCTSIPLTPEREEFYEKQMEKFRERVPVLEKRLEKYLAGFYQ